MFNLINFYVFVFVWALNNIKVTISKIRDGIVKSVGAFYGIKPIL